MSELQIGDRPDYGAFIPSQLDDYPLSMPEFRLFCHISRRAGTYEGKFWESAEKAAAHCLMETKTFTRTLTILEQAGLIRVIKRPGKTSEIRLMHYKHWVDPKKLPEIRRANPSPRKRPVTPDCTDRTSTRLHRPVTPDCTDRTSTRLHRPVTPDCTDEGTPSKVLPDQVTPLKVNTPSIPQGGSAIANFDFENFPFEEIGQSEIEHLQAELTEPEESKPEPASLSNFNISTPEAKQKTRSATRRRVKSEPESAPEIFNQWWRSYYDFCLKVDCSPGDRATAATTWDVLHAIEADCTSRILEGSEWYQSVKEREFDTRGDAVGVPHGCRFLSKRKWQEALDHKAFKPDFLTKSTPVDPAAQRAKNIAELEELRKQIEAKNAKHLCV